MFAMSGRASVQRSDIKPFLLFQYESVVSHASQEGSIISIDIYTVEPDLTNITYRLY